MKFQFRRISRIAGCEEFRVWIVGEAHQPVSLLGILLKFV
jgi:hypothetical protein